MQLSKLMIVIMCCIMLVPIVSASDDWSYNLNKGVADFFDLSNWNYNFFSILDVPKQQLTTNYMFYCNTDYPNDITEDEIRLRITFCNYLKTTDEIRLNSTLLDEMYKYRIGYGVSTIYTVESVYNSTMMISNDVEPSEYQKKIELYSKRIATSKKNISYMWYSFSFIFTLIYSVLKLVYYIVELMFLAYLFLEFIPKQILSFRDVLVRYFVGKL